MPQLGPATHEPPMGSAVNGKETTPLGLAGADSVYNLSVFHAR